MKEVMILKKSPILRGGFIAYSDDLLIATVAKILKSEEDSKNGVYRICFTRGKLQGKIAYAFDLQDVNDKICAVIDYAKQLTLSIDTGSRLHYYLSRRANHFQR